MSTLIYPWSHHLIEHDPPRTFLFYRLFSEVKPPGNQIKRFFVFCLFFTKKTTNVFCLFFTMKTTNVFRVGGRIIISVWSMEQRHRKFESQVNLRYFA